MGREAAETRSSGFSLDEVVLRPAKAPESISLDELQPAAISLEQPAVEEKPRVEPVISEDRGLNAGDIVDIAASIALRAPVSVSKPPVRPEVVSEVPGLVVKGAQKSVAETGFMLKELQEDKFASTIDFLTRMRDEGYQPTRGEISAIGNPVLEYYVLKTMANAKKSDLPTAIGASLEELEALKTEAAKQKDISSMVASGYQADIQDVTPKDASFLEQATIGASTSMAPTLVGVGAGLTAGPTAGLLTGAALAGGASTAGSYMEATLKARELGVELTPEKKAIIALTDGFLESIGEGLSLRVALKTGVPLFDRFVKTIAAESSSEAVTEMMQQANEAISYNPNMTLKEFLYNSALAGTAGALGGGAVSTAVAGAEKLGQKLEERQAYIALDELIRTSEPALLTPEEEAIRLLDPKVSGVPLETPMQALQYALQTKQIERAGELADTIAGIPEHEPPVLIAKRLMEAGEIEPETMANFRKELIRRRAQAQTLHAGALQVLQGEASVLEGELNKAADENYVPTAEEIDELQFATQLEQKIRGIQNERTAMQVLVRDLEGRTGWLSRIYAGMASSPPGGLLEQVFGGASAWNNYEIMDMSQRTTMERRPSVKLAMYFKELAARQHEGLYPFSAPLRTKFDPLVEKKIPDWYDSKGAIADTGRMEHGTSVTNISDYMFAKRVTSVMDEWLKTFAPTARVFIIDRHGANLMGHNIGPGVQGFAFSNGPRMGVLFADTSLDEAEYMQVLAHEFGHFLGDTLLENATPMVRMAVLRAWSKEIKSRLNMSIGDAIQATRGVAGAARMIDMETKHGQGLEERVRDILPNAPYLRGYIFSFEEFKAHQLERALSSDFAGMEKAVVNFFKKYAQLVQRFFERFKKAFAPNKTYEQFLKWGALREKAKILDIQRSIATQQELNRYGMTDFSDEELTDLRQFLEKSFAKLDAPGNLRDAMRTSEVELQSRAVNAIKRIGLYESSLFTPVEGGPMLTPEQWVTGLEDAWLPGQEGAGLTRLSQSPPPQGFRLAANQGMPRSKAASRIGSFVKNYLRYSRHFRGRFTPDNSGYEGHLDKYSWYSKWIYSLEQMAKINPHIEQLQDYLGRVRDWARDRMAWIARADNRLRQWRNLTQEEQKVLGRFMLDQTHEGKFFDLNDPAVRQKYPLTPRALEMYNRIKSDFDDFITAIQATLQASAAKRLAQNPFSAAAEMKRITDRFNALRQKPYFPLSRFGDYLVIVRATQHVRIKGRLYQPGEVMHFEAFDTEFSRMAELDRIKGAYPTGEVKLDIASEAVRSLMGMPQPIIEALKNDPNIALSPEQKKAVDEYLYKIAPGQSFVKHLIQRRGVEGYTDDVQRAYANYFFHGASHLARIKHSEALSETIKATDITADLVETDASKRRLIANYMRRHFDFIMHPENDWSGVRAVIAVSYLAGVMKTAFINLSQVPLVTYPHLAAKFGDAKAVRALQKAYGDAWAMYHVTKPLTKEEEEALTRWAQGVPPLPGDEKIVTQWSKLTTEERQMLRQAQLEGWIDESQAMELAAMSEGSWLTRFKATSQAGYYWRMASHYAMLPFQAAEKLNRRVTAIAAFRLAQQEGVGYDQAFVAAREAVSATQYEYAKWNRAELLRGKKGVIFMFWQYMLNTLFFATGGDKGWWRWWAMMMMAGGVMGLPFAQNLMDLATWALTRWKGDRVNTEHELKKLAGELAETLHVEPDLLLHGVSRYGFGLIPFADMSGSLSMGRILPGTDVLAATGEKWSETVTRAASDVGGATSALVMRMLQAAAQDEPDVLRRIERGMPVTLGQQMLTAFRWYRRGAAETLSGADLTKFDVDDPWQLAEIVGKGALGLQPRSIAQGRPEQGQPGRDEMLIKQDFANYYRVRREMLMRKLDFEMEHGDRETVSEVREAIKRFNNAVPSKSLSITNQQIIRMRQEKEKSRFLTERGEAAQKMYRDLYRQVEEGEI